MTNDYDFDVVQVGDVVEFCGSAGRPEQGRIVSIDEDARWPASEELFDYRFEIEVNSDTLNNLGVYVNEGDIGADWYSVNLVEWNND